MDIVPESLLKKKYKKINFLFVYDLIYGMFILHYL